MIQHGMYFFILPMSAPWSSQASRITNTANSHVRGSSPSSWSIFPHHKSMRRAGMLSLKRCIVSVGKHFGMGINLGRPERRDSFKIPVSLYCCSYWFCELKAKTRAKRSLYSFTSGRLIELMSMSGWPEFAGKGPCGLRRTG